MAERYTTENLNAHIVSFIANVDVNETRSNELAQQIAIHVTNKTIKLLEIVISLREFITSDEDSTRQKALHCLSTVMANVDPNTLSKNDVLVIFDFYQSKMDDAACMEETLQGISTLVVMQCFYSSQIPSILKLLKVQYQPSQFLAATRYFAFLTLENILHRFKAALIKEELVNDMFIETFIFIATAEKDPRNLLISFRLNKEISSSLKNIRKFKEDLFDILFCYFPITFKPPKNDPYKITNSDLKLALRSAISSTSEFAEDAFGNLVDKMTASSPTVKNDTILTIKACIDTFGGESCLKHWLPVWNALKFEIMHNTDTEDTPTSSSTEEFDNYQDSLWVLTSISSRLIQYEESAFEKFYSHVFDELKPNFTYEKDLKQSCGIFSAIASVNVVTFNKVLSGVLPLFFENTNDMDVNKQKLLLLNLSFLFEAYTRVFGVTDKNDSKPIVSNKLADYKDEVLMLLSKAVTGTSKAEVTLRTLAVVQFTKLVKMSGYLTREEVFLTVQYLTEVILTDGDKNIYCACLEGLKVISDNYEDIVFEICLKHMLELLPEDSTDIIKLNDKEDVPLERILKVILDFTTSRHKLVKESIFGISTKLCSIAKSPHSNEYCFMLISCLYYLLDNNSELFNEKDATDLKKAVEMNLFTAMLNNNSIYLDNHNLTLLSTVLFFINLKTSTKEHPQELAKYLKLFCENSKILDSPKRSVVPFVKLLSSLDKGCDFPDASKFLEKVVTLLKSNENMSDFERLGYFEFLSVLSNKWVSERELEEDIDFRDVTKINLEISAWVTKGLVVKNSPLALTFVSSLMELLDDTTMGVFAAKLFEILVIDIPIFKKFENINWNNNVRLLHKQKFFNDVAPRLVESFKKSTNMVLKPNYLTALSVVLRNTPSNITITYTSELLPLLLQALELESSDVRVSSLQSLRDTVEQSPQLITEYVSSLVHLCLSLVKPGKHNTVMVRLLSLEILQLLAMSVPLNYLLVHKDDIIKGLTPTLDDKKRKVRKTCIDTRQIYYELGQVPFE